jgi:hypothetical protein
MADQEAIEAEFREQYGYGPAPKDYKGPAGPLGDPQYEVAGICHTCVHQYASGSSCTAFPDGIPAVVLLGDFVHTKPYPGDRGVQFKQKGGVK